MAGSGWLALLTAGAAPAGPAALAGVSASAAGAALSAQATASKALHGETAQPRQPDVGCAATIAAPLGVVAAARKADVARTLVCMMKHSMASIPALQSGSRHSRACTMLRARKFMLRTKSRDQPYRL
jgi:hypothetical protein